MPDDREFDLALAQSRPDVQIDLARLERARSAALRARAARRWPRRAAVAGLASGAVLSIGAAAAATVGLPFAGVHHTQTISNGDHCRQEFQVTSEGAQPAAMAAARNALQNLDLSTLDLADGLNAQRDYQWWGHGPAPDHTYVKDSQDLHESVALATAISNAVSDELVHAGYDPATVSVESSFTCDDQPGG